MFQVVEYSAPEKITDPIRGRTIIKREIRTYEEAVSEVQRMFALDGWKVTGFNEEQEYFWGHGASPSTRRRILKIER